MKKLLHPVHYKKYYKMLANEIIGGNRFVYSWCKTADCSIIKLDTEDLSPDCKALQVYCKHCDKLQCLHCREQAHRPLKCEDYETFIPDISQLLIAGMVKPCPKCKFPFGDPLKCNHITCPKCSH